MLTEEEEKAWKGIRKLEATIKQLREYGVEPAIPNDYLEKAKEDFAAGFYSFGITHSKKGQDAAEGLLQAYTEAWNAMYYAYDDIERARKAGDVSEMAQLYEEAENDLSESELVEAAKKANLARRKVEDLFEKGEPSFAVNITSGPLKPGIWNRASFTIKNTGQSHAKGVRMRVTGPVEIINLPEVHKIDAGTQVDIEIGVKPKGPGEFPLEIWFKGMSVATNKHFAIPTRCWVTAPKEETPRRPGEVDFFNINEVFLIYWDGRMISHASSKDTSDIDQDIMSSMLIAIRNFVKDSFKSEDAALRTFSFSKYTVVIEKGNYLYLAAVVEGVPPPQLPPIMRRVMERVEISYAGVIEEWDGQDAHFKDADKMLMPVFELVEKVKMRITKPTVRVRSGLEFYRGFVRLKVAIINETDTVITDAHLLLTFNKTALRLDRVEPDYKVDGSTVIIGNVQSKEKQTIAYYLDPMICQESTVDCTLTYKDFKNKLQHVDMKRRPVDIVCPLFYTPQTLNIAMLKRLVKDLKETDSKIFSIEHMDLIDAYEKAKAVVQGHDVRFVRDLNDTEPEVWESWYYGRVKQTGEEMVIRISARKDTMTLMATVASSNLANMTGLLAELGKMISGATDGSEIVTDEEVKATMERSGSLLDKLSEGEVAAESSEPLDLTVLMQKLKKKK